MLIPQEKFLRIGFPKLTQSEGQNAYALEYSGPTDELVVPKVGDTWGDFPGFVTVSNAEPIQLSGYSILSVTVSDKFNAVTLGHLTEVAYELEWAVVSRALSEHPAFRIGGSSALTGDDLLAIDAWKQADYTHRKDFKYRSDFTSDTYSTLSPHAQIYAKYLQIGVETYSDFAPVARKTSTYTGGPPNAASAGAKGSLPGDFPNPPSGTWEWLKNADRSIRAAGQRKWERVEEWQGSDKVLVDNRTLYP